MSLRFPRRTLRVLAAAALCVAGTAPALAAVTPSAAPDTAGNFGDIAYGSDGNVFELLPRLYLSDFNLAGNVPSVIGGSPLLSFSTTVSGAGTGLMTIDYRITNSSPTESFGEMRFMVFANPDGGQTDFLDRVSENWGAAAAGDPVRREAAAFTGDPVNNIPSRFLANRNLTDAAPSAACAAAAGCDAVMGLQWNTAALGPNESFLIRLGLSDNGSSVSGRSLVFSAVGDPTTTLTVSGFSQVVAVPEPSTWAMGLAGLALMAGVVRRRGIARPAR